MSTGNWLDIREWESVLKGLEVRQHHGQGPVVTQGPKRGMSELSLSFPGYKMGRHEDNKKHLACTLHLVSPQ